jgi:hypothetical protein
MKRNLTSLLLLFFLPIVLSAQLEKGDWMIDFQVNTNNDYSDLLFAKSFSSTDNTYFRIGKLLKKNLVTGVTYEMNNQHMTTYAIDEKFSSSTQRFNFGPFLRYYFGNQPEKRMLFIKSNFTWEYNKFKSTTSENDFLKRLRLDVGMGLSLFKFPTASFEMWLDYNLIRTNTNHDFDNARFGNSTLIFEMAFQVYLSEKFFQKWGNKNIQFLQKGRQIIGGTFQYDDITSNLFGQTVRIEFTPHYGYFVADRWMIGGETPVLLNFVFKDLDLNLGIGPFFRYYQPITNQLQVFGHLGLTSIFIGKSYEDFRTAQKDKWTFSKDLDTTCGVGLNYFLTEDLSVFAMYKYQVLQPFNSFKFNLWDMPESRVGLDMGLAFYF